MTALTVAQMKLAERLTNESGITYKRLMENAGTVAYEYINAGFGFEQKKTVILAGSGNNAGDGFVLARCIKESGNDVSVIVCCDEIKSALSKANCDMYRLQGGEVVMGISDPLTAKDRLDHAHIIVDAVFGTGFHGKLPNDIATFLRYANSLSATRIALDIPSGMNADTAETSESTFMARLTLAFAAYKKAHAHVLAKRYTGDIEVLDIGIPQSAIDAVSSDTVKLSAETIKRVLPVRSETANKGTYGRLLNIAGSATMNGAAMMSTLSAMRCGVGITVLAAPEYTARIAAGQIMEAMTIPLPSNEFGAVSTKALPILEKEAKKATAVLVGCGMTPSGDTKAVVDMLLQTCTGTVVIDADGLNALAEHGFKILGEAGCNTVITPHIGELARLLNTTAQKVIDNAKALAVAFAREYNTTLVLKSHITYIATPTGELFENTTGNSGLAKGGSGDVLAGMIAAFCAEGFTPRDAAICGVYLHGMCAQMLGRSLSLHSILARDVIDQIPYALKALDR